MAIWICQFVSREIRLLDYIEGVGQPLACYAGELRRRGWKEAVICLPHDGVATNNITGKRYIDHWREAGFECETPIKNTGAGAAMMRVEAARCIFSNCTEKPDELSDDELIALRDRYAALSGAAPKVIEHSAEQEEGAPDRFADDEDDRQALTTAQR